MWKETLAKYFSTVASIIGGSHVTSLSENEFSNHSHNGIQIIETVYNNSLFQIKPVKNKDVQVSF